MSQKAELLAAKYILSKGCPRTADVKASKNHLYLAKKGLAPAFNTPERVEQNQLVVAKHNAFQEAARTVARLSPIFSN